MGYSIKTVLITFFSMLFLTLLISSNTYAATDYKEYGVDSSKNMRVDLDSSKDSSNFVYDKQMDLSENKLITMLNDYTIFGTDTNGNNHSFNINNDGTFYFSSLSQEPLVFNNTIYANFGFVANNGDSYTGIIPLKISSVDYSNGHSYIIMLPSDKKLPAFKTVKSYFSSGTTMPVAPPIIIPNSNGTGAVMVYVVSQWFIKYNIDNDGTLNYEQSFQNTVAVDSENSIGGGAVYSASSGLIYIGSWNGRIYKINPQTMDYGYVNMRSLPISNEPVIQYTRISAEPTIVDGNSGQKRLLFGLGNNAASAIQGGGLCTSDLNLNDMKCSIGKKYYEINDNQTIQNITTIYNSNGQQTGIDSVLESSMAWSAKNKYAIGHDRWGNVYGFDAYAKMIFKDSSLKGSVVFGGISLDKSNSYAYLKVNSVRTGSSNSQFGNSLYNTSCDVGRIFRIDTNQIAYLMNTINRSSVYEMISSDLSGNLSVNMDIGDYTSQIGVIFSHKDWLSGSELTGYPFIMGKFLLTSSAGCSNSSKSGIFAANILYTSNSYVNEARTNASPNSPGRLNFIKNAYNLQTEGLNYIDAMSMGRFSGPVGGFYFNNDFQEGIITATGYGLTVLYLQNGDFMIDDLSVISNESDGKFYPKTSLDSTNAHVYNGHIRVSTGNNDILINPLVDITTKKIKIKVHHTNQPLSGATIDNYKCDNPAGFQSCYFTDNNPLKDTYTINNLLNNTGSTGNTSTLYRPLYEKDIPLSDVVLTKLSSDGTNIYYIPAKTEILNTDFDVFNLISSNITPTMEKDNLIAYIDMNDIIAESDEINNLGYRMIQYEGIPKPDLNLTCNIPTPTTNYYYNLNENYTIGMQITKNTDQGKIRKAFNYSVKQDGIVIKNGTIDPSIFPGGDNELQKNETINIPVNVSFTNSGDHTVSITVNPEQDSGNIPESDYSNNNCSGTFNTTIFTKPDLVGMTVGTVDDEYKFRFSGSTPIEGTDIIVRGVVKNVGQQRIKDDSRTYLKITHNGTTVTEIFSPCKAVISSNGTCGINITLPMSTLQLGVYSLSLKADYGATDYDNGAIDEQNENNNWVYGSFRITNIDSPPGSNYFSPNGGGIRDSVAMSLNNFYISDYSISYTIGVFDSNGNLIKTLATNSTAFRFPNVGRNPYYYSSQSAYYSNYLHYSDAYNSWNSLPKDSNGNYQWDGTDNYGNVVVDGTYRIGLQYTQENSSEYHHMVYVPNGCYTCDNYGPVYDIDGNYLYSTCTSGHYYGCTQEIIADAYYYNSTYNTNIIYGTEVYLDNHLNLDNISVKSQNTNDPNSLRGLDYLLIPNNITTSLEASEVTVSIPSSIINTSQLKTSSWTTQGNNTIIQLVPNWSTYYNANESYRCDADAYCNTWRLADGDAIVLNKDIPSGDHIITFTTKTRRNTPDSPVSKNVVIRTQDSIYNHIKIEENIH
jgi:hypothetical protein